MVNQNGARTEYDALQLRMLQWEQEVSPFVRISWDSTKTAAEFGRAVLQAGFLVNGGALVALPLLMHWLSADGRALVPVNAWWFVAGIVAAASACLAAYFNFLFLAELNTAQAQIRAVQLTHAYKHSAPPTTESNPDYGGYLQRAGRNQRLVAATQTIAVAAGLLSFVFFVVGIYGYISVADAAPTQ